MDWQTIWQSAFVTGAVSGLVAAAAVDFAAFRAWKSLEEATTYNWGVATWRWVQGFVGGGLGATIFRGIAS
jgi:hypothetical protein